MTRIHAAELLEGMKVKFKGEIGLLEETIVPEDIPAPHPNRRRIRLQQEAAELDAGLMFNTLTFGATGATRRGRGFRPQ
ncbi:hypothetical protein AMTRI_Chr13g117300 [Amborella trichopoda]